MLRRYVFSIMLHERLYVPLYLIFSAQQAAAHLKVVKFKIARNEDSCTRYGCFPPCSPSHNFLTTTLRDRHFPEHLSSIAFVHNFVPYVIWNF